MATFAMSMDDDFKKDFEAVCEELGCDIPTVIRMLGEKMIRERRIPFDIDADPFNRPRIRPICSARSLSLKPAAAGGMP